MTRTRSVTVTRSIELDIEVEVEVTPSTPDHYDRAVGGPGGWTPGDAAEAEIVSAQTDDGWDVMKLLSERELEAIKDRAIEIASEPADEGI